MKFIVFERDDLMINVQRIIAIDKMHEEPYWVFILENGNKAYARTRFYSLNSIREAIASVKENNPLGVEENEIPTEE